MTQAVQSSIPVLETLFVGCLEILLLQGSLTPSLIPTLSRREFIITKAVVDVPDAM